MTKRRIFPIAFLLLAIGCWQSMFVRGARSADDGRYSGTPAAPAIRNPFVDSAEPATVTTSATKGAETKMASAPRAETRPSDRMASAPVLEPMRPRRVNPQLAGNDERSDAETPPQQPEMKTRFGDRQRTRAARPDRYAQRLQYPGREESVAVQPVSEPEPLQAVQPASEEAAPSTDAIIPVSHNEPLSETTAAPEAAPEPEPESPVEQLATPPTNEPTPAEPEVADRPVTALEPRPLPETADMPVAEGEQRGGVTLQWITPSAVSVDQEATCQLTVRNVSDAIARFVVVDVQLPAGVEFGMAEPKAAANGRRLTWEFGDMPPGSSQRAQITFTPREQGDVTPQAAVTFTRHVAATIQIVEPQLALAIEGPRESIVGQPTPYQFRVTNKGTGAAVGVSIDVAPADGLEIANGSQAHYSIGTLSPGESRHVQVMMSGERPGDCTLHGQASIDKRPMDKASCSVRITQPALSVAMEGPKLRFVDRRAAYTITVQNPGPAPIDNVQLMEKVPDGFRFVEASSGGNYDRNIRQVAWFVGRLEANETATVGVQLIATEAGDHRLNAAAKADCGVVGEAETTTRVKGAPHVAIDVSEDDDPVEIDGETIYRVRLSNMGSTPARRVQFAAEVPREMEILETSGPATALIKGQQLVFPPVAVLEPGQSTNYDVHVRCKKAGQVRFKAYFRSEDAPDPVLEEETTRIYAD
ncbi:MAG TPA: hypothetical protein VHD36_12185 [Pirellulales bacterium]|nr:hypothetical protein [Pirellulales bacterium]